MWQAKEAGMQRGSGLDLSRLEVAQEGAITPGLHGQIRQPLLSRPAQDMLKQQRNALLWQQSQQAAEQRQDASGRQGVLDSHQPYVSSSRNAGAFMPLLRGSPARPGARQPSSEAYANRQPLYNPHA